MSLEDICALPVKELANPNAMLFLWCPSPLLPGGLEVMRAWGFDYVASAVWTKKGGRRSHMGGVFRVHHELLLIGKRGKGLPKPKTGAMISSVIEAPVTKHSAKPPVLHEVLEQLYPEFANERLELFARQPREGWDTWGNQAEETPAVEDCGAFATSGAECH
jgi:N6-adenosine-specific RNA methylase IME4